MTFPILSASSNPNNLRMYSVGIVAGADGKLWFDAVSADGRGYISSITTAGVVTNNLFSANDPTPGRIIQAPDGNVWAAIEFATPSSGSNVFEVSSTSGVVSERTLPIFANPYGVTAGPDGNIWFGDTANHEIARFSISSGEVSEFATSSIPGNLAVGGDGNIWFAENGGNIGRCGVGGTIVEFTPSSAPWDLTKGPDGNIWFTEPTANAIGKITSNGQITEYPAPASPSGIAAGPDGNIWFTEPAAGKIARFVVP
jgi:streptogramin lyase